MTAFQLTTYAFGLAVGWLAGMVIGAVHFFESAPERANAHRGPLVVADRGHSARTLRALAVVLAAITRSFGALPLLAAALGILTARTIIVRKEA